MCALVGPRAEGDESAGRWGINYRVRADRSLGPSEAPPTFRVCLSARPASEAQDQARLNLLDAGVKRVAVSDSPRKR